MTKRIFLYTAIIVAMATVLIHPAIMASDIKMKKPVFEDYIPLLEEAGYFVYSFDIKSLNDKRYLIKFSCREYKRDSLVNKNIMTYPFKKSNLMMLEDFPEEDQKDIRKTEMYDSERGIYKCAEKIVIGTYPQNDSTTNVIIDIDEMGRSTLPLSLRTVMNPRTGTSICRYMPRPFEVGEFKLGTFIPLMFYGSLWFDEKYGFFRFCGEDVLNPEMTDMLIKDVPHSYVIGITVTEMSE